jgi:hypothetical protein
MALLTGVLPVNEIFLMRGSSHSFLPTAGVNSVLAVTTLITPAGMPARSARMAMAEVVIGVSGDGLTTIVQPAARAVTIFRKPMTTGKFHLSRSALTFHSRTSHSRAKEPYWSNGLFGDNELLVGIVGVLDDLPLNSLTLASHHPDIGT